MWRSAASRSLRSGLLSSISQNPSPNPNVTPIYSLSSSELAFTAQRPAFLHSSSVGGGDGTASSISESASPSGEVAAMIGSVGAVSSFVSDRAGYGTDLIRHYGRCYWELSKARLSLLVVATSGTGYVLGSGNTIDFAGLCFTCAGTMMVAASANSLNQVFEKENDARMKRTSKRPLPSGRISIPHAATWASAIGLAGTTLLAYKTNSLATGLAASNLVLYSFVYTPLKQIHPVNTWVGAIVGAIPPLLGWAAASTDLSLKAWILPAALYYWQIPHFMALAYLCRNDYLSGGFKMFSFNDPSGSRTAMVSLRNCLYLLPLGWLAYEWGLASEWFALESSLVTLCITIAALKFVREKNTKNARKMFHASLIYLPVFMSGLLLHRQPNEQCENNTMDSNDKVDCVKEVFLETELLNEDEYDRASYNRKRRTGGGACAPVAYASVAPFPFLPVPLYVSPDS